MTTRGRPRDPEVEARILRAAVEELADVGAAAFSLNSVATRAGVAKRSIYSRWEERSDLISASLASLPVGLSPPGTGSLERDLRELFAQIVEMLSEPRKSILTRYAAELSACPELYAAFQRDVVDQSMAVIEDALVDAERRGEIHPGTSLSFAAEFFVSAIFGRASFAAHTQPGGPGQAADLEDNLIALTLRALRP